jgi:hypothetical protein
MPPHAVQCSSAVQCTPTVGIAAQRARHSANAAAQKGWLVRCAQDHVAAPEKMGDQGGMAGVLAAVALAVARFARTQFEIFKMLSPCCPAT